MRKSKMISVDDMRQLHESMNGGDRNSNNKEKQRQMVNKVSQEDFLFGAQSALRYEEYNVFKTNRHKLRQRRVLILDGNQIYHQKQMYDPKTGLVR